MMVTLRGNQGSNSMVKWSYGQVVQWPNGPMVPWHVILQNAPLPQCSYGVQRSIGAQTQAVTTCGLSSLASFLKMLSSKRVCCVFCDIRDKNAVNQGFTFFLPGVIFFQIERKKLAFYCIII